MNEGEGTYRNGRRATIRRLSVEDDPSALELQQSAKVASIYHKDHRGFHRNAKLSRLVHASLCLTQFLVSLLDEIFHHGHHYLNRKLREKNPDLPFVPEERNPVFFLYPVCVLISLLMGILWLTTRTLERRPLIPLSGCTIGTLFMLCGAIASMRHAEVHINLGTVSDEELITHPVFVHCFVMCIMSLFGMIVYLIQGWLLYDVFRWQRRKVELDRRKSVMKTFGSTPESSATKPDDPKSMEIPGQPSPVLNLDHFPSHFAEPANLENEPIILYCCCIDCCNYMKYRYFVKRATHEFQVIHVM